MFGREKKKPGAAPPDEIFPPVDFNAVRKRLRLEARGLEHGRAGRPAADAANLKLNPVEGEIVAAIEAVRRQGLEDAAEHGRVYRGRIAAGGAIGPGIRQITMTQKPTSAGSRCEAQPVECRPRRSAP